jgi:hypothetical protein
MVPTRIGSPLAVPVPPALELPPELLAPTLELLPEPLALDVVPLFELEQAVRARATVMMAASAQTVNLLCVIIP